jgi:pantoate--beta-alanine ligase
MNELASQLELTTPRVITDGRSLRETIRAAQAEGKTVGFVPTMGALHVGHLTLVDASVADCDLTLASIFVNPTQFAPQEDFERYPRDLDRDLQMLGEHGCDLVFAPSVETMYRPGHSTAVDVGPIAQTLEGDFRPGHFRGVATIVLKLFQLAPVDRAYFGQKDYQQTLVVKQMAADLDVPVQICICPTVREPDGLAMSSRNSYMNADERSRAPALYQSLRMAAELVDHGTHDVAALRSKMMENLRRAGVEVQYIAFVADGTVTPVTKVDGPTVVAMAAKVGATRLIDNLRIEPRG